MRQLSWRERVRRIIWWTVLCSFLLPIGFLIIKITQSSDITDGLRSTGDYVLMLVQCILGLLAMFLPVLLARRFEFRLPSTMYVVFVLFLYAAIFLGEVRSFYYTVPHWDTILHTFSGGMLGALGFSLVSWLNKDKHTTLQLSPLFVAIFAFCFATALGTLWEIYEFTFDSILGLNMQKFSLEDGTQLVGRSALSDTMKDLCVDVLGALVVTTVGYLSLKMKRSRCKNGEEDAVLIQPKE